MVNASPKPGDWQTYDIAFEAPRFDKDGKLTRPGFVTVFHNGVLVQNHTEIKGVTHYGPTLRLQSPCGKTAAATAVPQQPCAFSQYLDPRNQGAGAHQEGIKSVRKGVRHRCRNGPKGASHNGA